MRSDRELTAVYIILGQSFIDVEPYDAKGAFILLNSIAAGLGDATPGFIDSASHLHMVAALGGNAAAGCEARLSMARLIGALERRLSSGVSMQASERSSP